MATYGFSPDSIKNMLGRFAKAADGAVRSAREALCEEAEDERRGAVAAAGTEPSLASLVESACAFERDRLGDGARRAYDELRKGMLGYQERIAVLGATGEELQDAYEALRYGTPEALWLDGFSRRRSAFSVQNWEVFPVYRISRDETARLLQEMADRSEPLLAALRRLPTAGQRVQAAHNALILNCTYSDTDDPVEATAAGALVNGKALCLGISLAFKYLMDRVDVPCIVMRGNANGSGRLEGAGPHAWNLVRMNGGWTHVDVTYDLTGSGDKRRPFFTYLGLSDAQIADTHVWDASKFPAATCAVDYYRRKGRYARSWDELAGLLDLTLARDGFCAFQLDERLTRTGAQGERALSAEELRRRIFDLARTALNGSVTGRFQFTVIGSNARHVYAVTVV